MPPVGRDGDGGGSSLGAQWESSGPVGGELVLLPPAVWSVSCFRTDTVLLLVLPEPICVLSAPAFTDEAVECQGLKELPEETQPVAGGARIPPPGCLMRRLRTRHHCHPVFIIFGSFLSLHFGHVVRNQLSE